MVFRKQDLSARYAHCYWTIMAIRSSQRTELANTQTHTLTHTYISIISFSISHPSPYQSCIYLSIYFKTLNLKPILLTIDCHHRIHFDLAPSHVYNFHSEKPASYYPIMFICSIIEYAASNVRIANTDHCKIKPTNQNSIFV